MMVQMAASNTLLQTLVAEDKRGRVMSFYTMAFFGMMPFGSLVAGSGAPLRGPDDRDAGGVATLLAVPLYVRKLPLPDKGATPSSGNMKALWTFITDAFSERGRTCPGYGRSRPAARAPPRRRRSPEKSSWCRTCLALRTRTNSTFAPQSRQAGNFLPRMHVTSWSVLRMPGVDRRIDARAGDRGPGAESLSL